MRDKPLKLLCRELLTGKGLTGRLSVSDRRMRLKLVCFDEFFYLRPENAIALELEDGRIATLFNCISTGPGSASHTGRVVHHGGAIPNIVLIGSEPWIETTPVRQAAFRFLESDTALLSTDIIDRAFKSDNIAQTHEVESGDLESGKEVIVIDYNKASILNVSLNDMHVHIWVGVARRSGPMNEAIKLQHGVTVDFIKEVSIHEYLLDVCNIVSLFSLSIGWASRPYDIRISELSSAESNAKIAEGKFSGDFEIRYVWPKRSPKAPEVWAGASVLQVIEPHERDASACCLVEWMNRREHWQAAYVLMQRSLKNRRKFGNSRLLSAFGWFEAIPLDDAPAKIETKQLDKIAAAAAEEAQKLELASVSGRIRGILDQLRNEPSSKRFPRLIDRIRTRFGAELVPDRIEQDCARAIKLRGKIIHGNIKQNDYKFGALTRAICAVECVSFLLMICDLPITEAAAKRIGAHPLMDYLRLPPAE